MNWKAIATKARTSLRLPSTTRDLDQHCHQGHQPIVQAKAYSLRGITLKNPRIKEPRKAALVIASGSQKLLKKKRKFGQGQNHQQRKNNNAFAFCINTTKLNAQKKKMKVKNKSNFAYFNCQKKSHFTSNYFEIIKAKI